VRRFNFSETGVYRRQEVQNETMKGDGVTIKKEEAGLFAFRTKSHQSIRNSLLAVEVTDAVLLVF